LSLIKKTEREDLTTGKEELKAVGKMGLPSVLLGKRAYRYSLGHIGKQELTVGRKMGLPSILMGKRAYRYSFGHIMFSCLLNVSPFLAPSQGIANP